MKHLKFFIVVLGITLALINSTNANARIKASSGTCSGTDGACGVSNEGCPIPGAYFN